MRHQWKGEWQGNTDCSLNHDISVWTAMNDWIGTLTGRNQHSAMFQRIELDPNPKSGLHLNGLLFQIVNKHFVYKITSNIILKERELWYQYVCCVFLASLLTSEPVNGFILILAWISSSCSPSRFHIIIFNGVLRASVLAKWFVRVF
jgi:hypothetical protein